MAGITIRPLSDSDRSAVGAVLAADGGYAQRVHGRPPESDDVTGLFTARPPTTQPEQKHLLGLFLGRELMGVADLATDWPEPGVNFLGLLQLRVDAPCSWFKPSPLESWVDRPRHKRRSPVP